MCSRKLKVIYDKYLQKRSGICFLESFKSSMINICKKGVVYVF